PEEAIDGARGHRHGEITDGKVAARAPGEVADADGVTHLDSGSSRSRASRNSAGERPRRAASVSIWRTKRRAADARSRPRVSAAIAATKVPAPCRISTMPSRSRSRYACTTVAGFTRSLVASARTEGSPS